MTTATTTVRSARDRLDHALVVVAFAVAVFGDILAFNQLATQSPIDANLQLLLFTIGIAGVIEGGRRIALGRDLTARLVGVAIFVVASLAVLAWAGAWRTEFQGLLSVVGGAVIGLLAASLLWRNRHHDTSDAAQFAAIAGIGQAMIAVWFGVLAITSLGR